MSLPVTGIGGVVLCGGKSSRMGLPKATLPFGPEIMLQRVVRLLSVTVQPIVVVAAAEQDFPSLAGEVIIARDQRPDRGPLEGILAGLSAISPHAEAAYVTSCDVPLLEIEFVRRLISLLGENDIVVPIEGEFPHPLAAVYRVGVVKQIESLLSADRLRPVFLYELARTRKVPADELRDVDPQLATLRNLNRPEDYFDALASAGFPVDPEVRARLG